MVLELRRQTWTAEEYFLITVWRECVEATGSVDTPERRQCGVRKEVNLDVNAEDLLHLKVRERKD